MGLTFLLFSALINSFNDTLLMKIPFLPAIDKKFDCILFVHPRSSLDHNQIFRGWKIYKLRETKKNDRFTARWVKLQVHKVLEGFRYDYSVWIDCNFSIQITFFPWILNVIRESYLLHFMSLVHPHRNCVYDEIFYCVRRGVIKKDVLEKLKLYFHDFPKKMGLIETKLVIRHHIPKVNDFGDQWWDMVRDVCVRDQCSLMPLLISSKLNYLTIPKKEFLKHAKEYKSIRQSRLVPGYSSSLLRFSNG